MRLANRLFSILADHVDTVFYVPGGGSMYLNDALGQSTLKRVSALHEQGAGFMAVGYAQIHGLGVCLTTSGPGATNAITPCLAAWMDGVPVIFISGQVRSNLLAAPGQRFNGPQEANITSIVQTITKHVWTGSARSFDILVHDAIILCQSERPGPVWIDVPLDVQMEEIGV